MLRCQDRPQHSHQCNPLLALFQPVHMAGALRSCAEPLLLSTGPLRWTVLCIWPRDTLQSDIVSIKYSSCSSPLSRNSEMHCGLKFFPYSCSLFGIFFLKISCCFNFALMSVSLRTLPDAVDARKAIDMMTFDDQGACHLAFKTPERYVGHR